MAALDADADESLIQLALLDHSLHKALLDQPDEASASSIATTGFSTGIRPPNGSADIWLRRSRASPIMAICCCIARL